MHTDSNPEHRSGDGSYVVLVVKWAYEKLTPKLSRASVPLDLMSYAAEDEQPSVFFLRESPRQSMLTVFNWTDRARPRKLSYADLRLPPDRRYEVRDILANQPAALAFDQPPHSVRMLSIVDSSIPAAAPTVTLQSPQNRERGRCDPVLSGSRRERRARAFLQEVR